MNEDEPGVLWPPTPHGTKDRRILAPIFGAFHSARHRLDDAAREHGMDAAEAMVLDVIHLDPLCAPWSIRRRLGFARSTMTSILDRLERDGRILRHPSAFTTQRFELELTPAGLLDAELAEYVIASLEAEIAGYTSPDQRRAAVALFEACMAIDRPERPHP
jgi:DNA-binding MarR family transcriptional regulator